MKTLKPRSTENMKHSPTVRQINVNPHTKNLFTSVPPGERMCFIHYCVYNITLSNKHLLRDFPGGPVVKNLLSNVGDSGSIPAQGT